MHITPVHSPRCHKSVKIVDYQKVEELLLCETPNSLKPIDFILPNKKDKASFLPFQESSNDPDYNPINSNRDTLLVTWQHLSCR